MFMYDPEGCSNDESDQHVPNQLLLIAQGKVISVYRLKISSISYSQEVSYLVKNETCLFTKNALSERQSV